MEMIKKYYKLQQSQFYLWSISCSFSEMNFEKCLWTYKLSSVVKKNDTKIYNDNHGIYKHEDFQTNAPIPKRCFVWHMYYLKRKKHF